MTSHPDPREQERFKETLARSTDCATLDELAALADPTLAAPSRARVSVHVATCERCEMELLLLKEFESASPRPEEEAAVAWIVGRLRRRFRETRFAAIVPVPDAHEEEKRVWRRLFRRRPLGAMGFALAAAMVVLAVNLELREGREPALPEHVQQGPEVYRSVAVQLLGPAGELDGRPAELRWEPVPGAASYSVEVMEVDRTALWKSSVVATRVALPEAVASKLVPGKPLLWRVQAFDAAGNPIATSSTQRFRVKAQATRAQPAPAAAPEPKQSLPARLLQAPAPRSGQLVNAMPCGGVAAVFSGFAPALSAATASSSTTGIGTGLSLKVLARTAPAGGVAQLTLTLTEPKPIATGCGLLSPSPSFDGVLGAALFNGAGTPSNVAGAAVIDGTSVQLQTVSPAGDFGLASADPIAVISFHVAATAAAGEGGKMTVNPTSQFFDPAGALYAEQIKPGSFTVGGSVSIDDVIPGSGFLPAGSTVTVMGTGFVPDTSLEIDGLSVLATTFVSTNRIDAVTRFDGELHGTRITATNPDRSRAAYYSYMRAARVGESARPLLARTMPIFPGNAASAAFVPVIGAAGHFFAIAVQNPDVLPAEVSLEIVSGDGPIAATAISLPPRSRIAREMRELFGITAPAGSFVAVTSDRPVHVLGLDGDDAAASVAPVLPALALP